jgi:hypothetical protein
VLRRSRCFTPQARKDNNAFAAQLSAAACSSDYFLDRAVEMLAPAASLSKTGCWRPAAKL